MLAGRTAFFIGKYRLVDLLGRSELGGNFLGEHTIMNRRVVIKAVSKEFGRDQSAVEQFVNRAKTIAALDHPNIVHAYSVDQEGQRYFMVMEHVEGRNLQALVEADGAMNFDQAADLIRQAALGLAHAHGREITHGNIRPANLLLTSEGVLKILDLGMAQLSGSEERVAGKVCDSSPSEILAYVAPEQLRKGGSADRRSDIFSLGCTLYFLLTGRTPFPKGVSVALSPNQGPRPISSWRPAVPQELVAVCDKMMAEDPDKRYQTAEDVAEAIAARNQPKRVAVTPTPARTASGPKADGWSTDHVETDSSPSPQLSQANKPPKALRGRWRLLLAIAIGGSIILLALVVAYFY
jgi:serine/threonine-protein kinase